MTTTQPPASMARLTDADLPIRKAKTPAQILDELGLPHTGVLLTALQAACDDHMAIRQQIKGRVQKIARDFDSMQENVRKLGAENVADLARVQIAVCEELNTTKDALLDTQKALVSAMRELTPAATEKVRSEHHQPMTKAEHAVRDDHLRKEIYPRLRFGPARKSREPGF